MGNPKKLEAERLSDLDDWEFYRIAEAGSEDAVCTIGLRPYSELRQVEYEVWAGDGGDEEPRVTGGVDCDSMSGHGARERVLLEILTSAQDELVFTHGGIEFYLRAKSIGSR
jgi:hypothetical protein